MPQIRAKLRLHYVDTANAPDSEMLHFYAVAAENYPEDGSDPDNTYAIFAPSASAQVHVTNPALIGQFVAGEDYVVEFTPAG